jgi:hypothetical protein
MINRMAHSHVLQSLATFLYHCLRYDPADRATMTQLRTELGRLRPELERQPWPLRLDM